MTVFVIANGKAGSSRTSTLQNLVTWLERAGYKVTVLWADPSPDSAARLAQHAVYQGASLIVVVGGDGTIRLAAQGLWGIGAQVPMAAFPGGTGNLFARSFYSVPTAEAFLEMVRYGTAQPIDLIEYRCTDLEGNAHRGTMLVALGIGDFSDAIVNSDQDLKRKFGSLVYAVNMTKSIGKFKPLQATLTYGKQKRNEMLSVGFVFNVVAPKFAAISRHCNASDGLMDFVGFRGTSKSHLLPAAMGALSGRPDRSAHYCRWRVPELVIETDRPMLLDLDGDAGPQTKRVELKVLPGAARMIVA